MTRNQRRELEIRCLDLAVALKELLRVVKSSTDRGSYEDDTMRTARERYQDTLLQHDLTMVRILTRRRT